MPTKPKVRVFLDSGAYSAWTHNKTIPLKAYIKFIKDAEKWIWMYVNLDVIPGSIDHPRTSEEVEASAQQSYDNLQEMKAAGLRPLPVFHQGESFKWLDKMLKDGETFIGISSAKNLRNEEQERWLDEFFSVVTNKKGEPLIKVHGFGSAHINQLRLHPYYSVDSAGWRIAAAYGKMYVPRWPNFPNGRPDYLKPPELITMTGNLQVSKHGQDRQFDSVHFNGPMHQALIRRFLEEEVGVNVGMARYSDRIRYRALAVYYQRVSEALVHVRFDRHLPFGMDRDKKAVAQLLASNKVPNTKHLNFVFSTAYDGDCCAALLEAKADLHLLSYYEIKNRPEILEKYAMEGKVLSNRPPVGVEIDWENPRYVAHRGRSIAKRILELGREENVRAHVATGAD